MEQVSLKEVLQNTKKKLESVLVNKDCQEFSSMEIQLSTFQELYIADASSSHSLKRRISNLRHQIQNKQKHTMTDFQAFNWENSINLKIQLLPTFKIIKVPQKIEHVSLQILKKETNFPIITYTGEELVKFAVMMLSNNSYAKENFKSDMLHRLMERIALKYNIVSYHNFSHAFSLALLLFQCLENDQKLKNICSSEQKFLALIAGFSHDMNHRGTNNNFQVKLKTELAAKYNNESVLENMHIGQLWEIIRQFPDLDFISNSKNTKMTNQNSKKLITRLILATDVAQHFKNLKHFSEAVKGQNFNVETNLEDRYIAMEQLIHACDIGNPCLSIDNYMNWAVLVSHEFHEQFKLEKQLKNYFQEPNAMFEFKGMKNFYKGQKGFSSALVLPLWRQIAVIFPGLEFLPKNIERNIEELDRLIESTDDNA